MPAFVATVPPSSHRSCVLTTVVPVILHDGGRAYTPFLRPDAFCRVLQNPQNIVEQERRLRRPPYRLCPSVQSSSGCHSPTDKQRRFFAHHPAFEEVPVTGSRMLRIVFGVCRHNPARDRGRRFAVRFFHGVFGKQRRALHGMRHVADLSGIRIKIIVCDLLDHIRPRSFHHTAFARYRQRTSAGPSFRPQTKPHRAVPSE